MSENNLPVTPLLPGDELAHFVAAYFDRKHLYQNIIQKYGSPLWILESSTLKQNAQKFTAAFNQFFPETSFYFAMKSNNHPEVSATLLESGFGLDVSSGVELTSALALGAKDIIFSGPGKTNEELALAISHADRTTILLDSLGELERLKTLTSESDSTTCVRVGIRLTTNPNGLWRKFGIVPELLITFWNEVKDLPNIRFKGLQFHSSWNLTPDRQVEFICLLGKILNRMPARFNESIEFIDIGGGYWPEEGEWLQFAGTKEGLAQKESGNNQGAADNHYRIPSTPIEIFAKTLYRAMDAHIFPQVNCRICFEPGRWICHSAMHIFFTAVDKKDHDLVITDAGTNAIGWERFEIDYFPILNLSQSSLTEKACDIFGSLCTPHDVWGYSYFGKDIKVGDLLMIPCQGSYTYSLGQNFIKPLPLVVKI
ncbi:MAG: decarboxylase [Desulfobacterium sp.]|nr:decarboxylase [Desulfobacterium sp.]